MTNEAQRVTAWRQWGRSKFHLVPAGSSETVCGQAVPEDARTTPYRSENCMRCEHKASPDLLEAAEKAREELAGLADRRELAALRANRAGNFVVYRCKKCGRQHIGAGQGVPICFGSADMHEAELEAVKVKGPAWTEARST